MSSLKSAGAFKELDERLWAWFRRHPVFSSAVALASIAAIVLLVIPESQVCQLNNDFTHEYCSYHNALSVGAFYLSQLLSDFGTVITGVATIAVAAFTATLWIATREMQQASAATLDHLRKEFVAEHRPWVTLDCEVAGPLKYDGNVWRLPIKYRVQNIGRTPASHVNFFASILPLMLSVYTDTRDGDPAGAPMGPPTVATDVMMELEGVCRFHEVFVKHKMEILAQSLFPNEQDESIFGLAGNPTRFSEAAKTPGYSGQFLVAGCVSYGSTFSDDLFRTAKAFAVYKPHGDIDLLGEVLPISPSFTLMRSYAS